MVIQNLWKYKKLLAKLKYKICQFNTAAKGGAFKAAYRLHNNFLNKGLKSKFFVSKNPYNSDIIQIMHRPTLIKGIKNKIDKKTKNKIY